MPRFPRKVRQDKSQPVEKPRQDRAEQVETPNADTAPPPEESDDSLADETEQQLEVEPQEVTPPNQTRADEEATEPMVELVDDEDDDDEDGDKMWYEDFPVLLTSSELGEMMEVARTTVYSWRLVGFLPEPLRVLPQIGAVWLKSEIRDWLASGEWANHDRARSVHRLFREHGEDLNKWVQPDSDLDDYLPATVSTGIIGNKQPIIRNEQRDAALDDIDQAFVRLNSLKGTEQEYEALALIANRLSHITKVTASGG